MSKKQLIDIYFNQLNSFLQELERMYPEDPDFPSFISSISLVKFTNPMLVVNYMKTEVVEPFGDKIAERDESFFIDSNAYLTDKEVNFDIVAKLKQYIKEMSPETKETVWKYIDIITKLCSKITEM
jgi:hypothetical protein